MDSDIQNVHSILTDAELPSSINDLKLPTQEFIVNLITAFLKQFNIDPRCIMKPTEEQQQIVSDPDDFEIISTINLHSTMEAISTHIFLNDFSITDIINPGPKRARRQAKFLANFILYANNKIVEIEPRKNEICNRRDEMNNLLQKQNKIKAEINDKSVVISRKIAEIDKLKSQIKSVNANIERHKKTKLKVGAELQEATQNRNDIKEHHSSLKNEFNKMKEENNELKLDIVQSPEQYRKQLSELNDKRKCMEEKRNTMEKAILDRQKKIKHTEEVCHFFEEQEEKLLEFNDIIEQLKNARLYEGNNRKELESLKNTLKKLQSEIESLENQCSILNLNEIQSDTEKRLIPLQKRLSQLLGEKELVEKKIENDFKLRNETYCEKEQMIANINQVEAEIQMSLNKYQELYDSEIDTETVLYEMIKRKSD